MDIDLKNGIFFLSKKRNFYCEINPENGEIDLCGGKIYLSDKEKNKLKTLLDKKTVFRNTKTDLKKLLDIVEKLNE
ncbi:hypothetical protein UFOVP615_23 [uncultured Caudovirales phage]|uniref:Uncharacterized protein n=1 Tax=uncultured Caudovirales phage TaxID=2100421 RepID=A0A6J5N1U0_9CAUD|nr:hypothetical protein UFOVP615_23 [uncultured Caudovirales phage]